MPVINGPTVVYANETDVTASRAIDATVYTNPSGTLPLKVQLRVNSVPSFGGILCWVGIGAASHSTTPLNPTGAALDMYCEFIVPPGGQYKVNISGGGAPVLNFWYEYQ